VVPSDRGIRVDVHGRIGDGGVRGAGSR